VDGDRGLRHGPFQVALLRPQFFQVGLARGHLVLQRDHLVEVLGGRQQGPYTVDAGLGGQDLGVQVRQLFRHVGRVALQAGAPPDARVQPGQERLHLIGRQLEHQVAGSRHRVGEVQVAVVQLTAVGVGESDDLVDGGGRIRDLHPDGHRDHQFSPGGLLHRRHADRRRRRRWGTCTGGVSGGLPAAAE